MRIVIAACLFVTLSLGGSWLQPVYASDCEAVVGTWAWFVGGEVTVKSDGTFAQQSGNSGTWTCTDASKGAMTLIWKKGGFVNQMLLSADGKGLSSTDPSQPFVTAKRIGAAPSDKGESQAPAVPTVILTTESDGSRQVPKDLPELMHGATQRARMWRHDAIPVSLEFQHFDAPNPKLTKGPRVVFSFSSPSEDAGLKLTVTTTDVSTFAFSQPVNWGGVSLPPVFVDLPAALRIARKNGMKGPLGNASLRIYSPGGAPPVLAWMVQSSSAGLGRTVNGATGEIIDYDVTGYIAAYNAQWERAAKGLRALMRNARGGSSSGSSTIGGDSAFPSPSSGSDTPYDDGSKAREQHERDAAESRAYWSGDPELYNRVKNGECTWSDSSKVGC
jgi:hypothetical protein